MSARKYLGFALLVLSMGYSYQARAAYIVTDLTYSAGSQTLSGYSGTYLDYYEQQPYWYCMQTEWAYFPGFPEPGIEVCTGAIVEYPFAEVSAAEYSPYGQVSYRYGYSPGTAAVGFPTFHAPQSGTWYAYGDHYVQTELYWCDAAPIYNNGWITYVFHNCMYLYNTGINLGSTYDQVTIGCSGTPATILAQYESQSNGGVYPNAVVDRPTCAQFATTGGSTYFTWNELSMGSAPHQGNPSHPWAAILPGLWAALDATRAAYGSAISIGSGYRTPAGNQAVQGASQSKHMAGHAADFKGASMASGAMMNQTTYNYWKALAMQNGFTWTSDFGDYPSHIHGDMR